MRACVRACVRAYVRVCVCACIRAYEHAGVYVRVSACKCVCACLYVRARVRVVARVKMQGCIRHSALRVLIAGNHESIQAKKPLPNTLDECLHFCGEDVQDFDLPNRSSSSFQSFISLILWFAVDFHTHQFPTQGTKQHKHNTKIQLHCVTTGGDTDRVPTPRVTVDRL